MILSRSKPAEEVDSSKKQKHNSKKKRKLPELEEFLSKRDYTGALTLLDFCEGAGKPLPQSQEWQAYGAFHLGKFAKALKIYKELLEGDDCDPVIYTYLACCCFFLGMYDEADAYAEKGPQGPLQNRLQFHISHKFGDEKRLMGFHKHLKDVVEDQLSLASIHYLRSHYQEAIDIYKRLQLDHPEYHALNAYIALCYYKLDYYDVSQEVLQSYLQEHPDSATALNLKACNHFRLYNGKAAEAELLGLQEKASQSFEYAQDIIKHNLVVFKDGEGALQVLPRLLDVLPEARLNLIIYYLKQNDLEEAYKLTQDLDPSVPQDYILKGVVNACVGQENESQENLKLAQQYFQLVGGSASECDTIPGRQCMASCFFLLKQFDDVLIYLESIKSYFYNDDTFNFNYGQTLASSSKWKEAEESFLLVQSEVIRNDYIYLSWLARCYIMNRKPRLAWEAYLKMETSGDSYHLLQLIANDCYKMGAFFYSAKAFDVLERLDPDPSYWTGKRGACIGVFQQIIAGHEPRESLREMIAILNNSNNPQVENITRIMKRWAKENRVAV